jgi:hypothetical protein
MTARPFFHPGADDFERTAFQTFLNDLAQEWLVFNIEDLCFHLPRTIPGQRDCETTSFAVFAVHLDFAVVSLHDASHIA